MDVFLSLTLNASLFVHYAGILVQFLNAGNQTSIIVLNVQVFDSKFPKKKNVGLRRDKLKAMLLKLIGVSLKNLNKSGRNVTIQSNVLPKKKKPFSDVFSNVFGH